jgi:endogenous inhibitor of DNA gyrase (YacG/DUF329 family)
MSQNTPTKKPGLVCPTCRKPAVHEHRPFCSKRCADIDLARWLGGRFVIPGGSLDVADDSGGELGDGAGDSRSDPDREAD